MHHFLSHTDLGSKVVGQGSSSWGWVSDDGREFAIIGQGDGAAFAEVSFTLTVFGVNTNTAIRLPMLANSAISDDFPKPLEHLPVDGEKFEHINTTLWSLQKRLIITFRSST